jgi:hypothetical protein
MGSCGKTCRRACWLNLEAHPAHDESEVSFRICSRDIEITSFRIEKKKTLNVHRPTLNAQLSELNVESWALSVEC